MWRLRREAAAEAQRKSEVGTDGWGQALEERHAMASGDPATMDDDDDDDDNDRSSPAPLPAPSAVIMLRSASGPGRGPARGAVEKVDTDEDEAEEDDDDDDTADAPVVKGRSLAAVPAARKSGSTGHSAARRARSPSGVRRSATRYLQGRLSKCAERKKEK